MEVILIKQVNMLQKLGMTATKHKDGQEELVKNIIYNFYFIILKIFYVIDDSDGFGEFGNVKKII